MMYVKALVKCDNADCVSLETWPLPTEHQVELLVHQDGTVATVPKNWEQIYDRPGSEWYNGPDRRLKLKCPACVRRDAPDEVQAHG